MSHFHLKPYFLSKAIVLLIFMANWAFADSTIGISPMAYPRYRGIELFTEVALNKHNILKLGVNYNTTTFSSPEPMRGYGSGSSVLYRYYLNAIKKGTWFSEVGVNFFHGKVRSERMVNEKTIRESMLSVGYRLFMNKSTFVDFSLGKIFRSDEITLKVPSRSDPGQIEEDGYKFTDNNFSIGIGILF